MSEDEFERKTIEKIFQPDIGEGYSSEDITKMGIEVLKDYKAQILRENPLAGLSEDDITLILSIFNDYVSEKTCDTETMIESAHIANGFEKELSRRKKRT